MRSYILKSVSVRCLSFAIALASPALAALAVDANFQETFSSGLNGWGGGSSPTLIPNGGPGGAGDQFLRISSAAGTGNGNLATFNTGAAWTGDYAGNWMAPGEFLVIGLQASLANFGTEPLSIRAIFFNTVNNRYSTFDVAQVPADGVWRDYMWSFDSATGSGLVNVQGLVPITTGMHNVTQIMLRHNINPGAGGDAVTGTLGIDNIRLVPFVPAPAGACLLGVGSLAIASRRRRHC